MTPSSRGLWCTLSDPNVVRIWAGLGFDWLALDAQHGDIDRRALDAGASTVIVPKVDTAAEAAAAVAATFYPPVGDRS